MNATRRLDAPPDGAALASLDARRDWLADPRIAAVLPREGLLWLPDGRGGGWVSLTATALSWGTTLPADAATVALTDTALALLQAAWRSSWNQEATDALTSSDGAEASQFLLLHWRGVFAVRAGNAFAAGLAAARVGAAAR